MRQIDRPNSRKSASSAKLIWPSYGIRSLAAVRARPGERGRGGARGSEARGAAATRSRRACPSAAAALRPRAPRTVTSLLAHPLHNH